MRQPRNKIFDFDMNDVIRKYAARFVYGVSDHETEKEFCEQVAADLKIPQAKGWVRNEIRNLQKETVTI